MRHPNHRLACLLLALMSLWTPACNSAPPEPEPTWRRTQVTAPSDRVLWKVTLLACQKMGFPFPSGDPSSLVVNTGWKNDLAPFKAQGHRTRAEIHLNPVSEGVWEIEAHVQKQVNMSLVRPLDLTMAEWEWRRDDVEAAGVLVQHIRSYLGEDIELRDRPDDPIEAYLEAEEDDSR